MDTLGQGVRGRGREEDLQKELQGRGNTTDKKNYKQTLQLID